MNRFWSGILAVVVGAIVGTLVSKEIAGYFGLGLSATLLGAVAGAVFGGASAWVGADVPHFMQGVSRAWNEVISYHPSPMRGARNMFASLQTYIVLWGTLASLFSIFMIFTEDYGAGFSLVPFMRGWGRYTVLTEVSFFIAVAVAVIGFVNGCFFGEEGGHTERERDEWKDMVVYLNPVTTPLVVMLGLSAVLLVLGAVWSLVWHHWVISLSSVVALILWAMREVFVAAYVYVHTYQRRCAFVGAVVGVLVASFTGHSVLVGAIVGVLTFSAEYQLAMRVFPKLAPR